MVSEIREQWDCLGYLDFLVILERPVSQVPVVQQDQEDTTVLLVLPVLQALRETWD